ncbi:hypothetical protein BDB00DRAFT_790871 [Zychaea mexicana]|uniref:uncharacterized protein n=1 Tax=Zychaea mexicana TaxID=64656 RepID=UPI0022FE18A6|nr:uncharacterized protein BDB00DRAFT_790871 [Zychaea mexicana]KAI9489663.1 hypothetical protein BDB00DRAFT_790871 [Zychaea mexicana]
MKNNVYTAACMPKAVLLYLFTIDYQGEKFKAPLLEHLSPATEQRRFEKGDTLICESVAPWSRCLPQLFYTASLVAKTVQGKYSTFGAAAVDEDGNHPRMVLLEHLAQALQYIESWQGVFDRTAFEKRYKLDWIDDDDVACDVDYHDESDAKPKFSKRSRSGDASKDQRRKNGGQHIVPIVKPIEGTKQEDRKEEKHNGETRADFNDPIESTRMEKENSSATNNLTPDQDNPPEDMQHCSKTDIISGNNITIYTETAN